MLVDALHFSSRPPAMLEFIMIHNADCLPELQFKESTDILQFSDCTTPHQTRVTSVQGFTEPSFQYRQRKLATEYWNVIVYTVASLPSALSRRVASPRRAIQQPTLPTRLRIVCLMHYWFPPVVKNTRGMENLFVANRKHAVVSIFSFHFILFLFHFIYFVFFFFLPHPHPTARSLSYLFLLCPPLIPGRLFFSLQSFSRKLLVFPQHATPT